MKKKILIFLLLFFALYTFAKSSTLNVSLVKIDHYASFSPEIIYKFKDFSSPADKYYLKVCSFTDISEFEDL